MECEFVCGCNVGPFFRRTMGSIENVLTEHSTAHALARQPFFAHGRIAGFCASPQFTLQQILMHLKSMRVRVCECANM